VNVDPLAHIKRHLLGRVQQHSSAISCGWPAAFVVNVPTTTFFCGQRANDHKRPRGSKPDRALDDQAAARADGTVGGDGIVPLVAAP
jgi:hypothetical protein